MPDLIISRLHRVLARIIQWTVGDASGAVVFTNGGEREAYVMPCQDNGALSGKPA